MIVYANVNVNNGSLCCGQYVIVTYVVVQIAFSHISQHKLAKREAFALIYCLDPISLMSCMQIHLWTKTAPVNQPAPSQNAMQLARGQSWGMRKFG